LLSVVIASIKIICKISYSLVFNSSSNALTLQRINEIRVGLDTYKIVVLGDLTGDVSKLYNFYKEIKDCR
jgi:hypothetical protein